MFAVTSRRDPALPTFFVIGAAKCGSTSLHRYLDLHPEIGMSREKEPHLFSVRGRSDRDLTSYMGLFDAAYRVRGESSVGYTLAPHRAGVPERISKLVPDARLVYLVRDPIERFISDYAHQLSDGKETGAIDETAFALANTRSGDRGRYFYQIQCYLETFDRSSLHVIVAERLARARRETLSALFAFLETDPDVWGEQFERRLHESRDFRRKGPVGRLLRRIGNSAAASIVPADKRRDIGRILYRPFSRPIARPTLSRSARAYLTEYYRDDVAALRDFLDDPLEEWGI
jgi:hypothetical protein